MVGRIDFIICCSVISFFRLDGTVLLGADKNSKRGRFLEILVESFLSERKFLLYNRFFAHWERAPIKGSLDSFKIDLYNDLEVLSELSTLKV